MTDPQANPNEAQINKDLAQVSRIIKRQTTLFDVLGQLLEVIVTTGADLKTQAANLKQHIKDDNERDQQAMDKLTQVITDLRDQLANGASQQDLSEIATTISEALALITPATSPELPPDEPPAPTP